MGGPRRRFLIAYDPFDFRSTDISYHSIHVNLITENDHRQHPWFQKYFAYFLSYERYRSHLVKQFVCWLSQLDSPLSMGLAHSRVLQLEMTLNTWAWNLTAANGAVQKIIWKHIAFDWGLKSETKKKSITITHSNI